MREKIGLSDSTFDVIFKLSEGNPGALDVCAQMVRASPMGPLSLLDLDDMNIRGPQIWVGYKDHCKQDLDAFMKAVRGRDPLLVATINKEIGGTELAVTSGASFKR